MDGIVPESFRNSPSASTQLTELRCAEKYAASHFSRLLQFAVRPVYANPGIVPIFQHLNKDDSAQSVTNMPLVFRLGTAPTAIFAVTFIVLLSTTTVVSSPAQAT